MNALSRSGRATKSDDEFQTAQFVGGCDATEGAFTFSWYDPDEVEWWFTLTMDEAARVAAGENIDIRVRRATGVTRGQRA